jgi:hypothetical protein
MMRILAAAVLAVSTAVAADVPNSSALEALQGSFEPGGPSVSSRTVENPSIPNTERLGIEDHVQSDEMMDRLRRLRESQIEELRGRQPFDVMVLVADDQDHSGFRTALEAYADIGSVDFVDARSVVPTLGSLLMYDAVVTWPNYAYSDPVATGDTLAEYADAGGVVVCASWCWYVNMNHLDGAIMDSAYNPFTGLGPNYFTPAALGWYDPDHLIMSGVATLEDQIRDDVILNPGADSVVKWDDGSWLVATKGRVVGVNANPGDYGYYSGDMVPLFHNAIFWALSGVGGFDVLLLLADADQPFFHAELQAYEDIGAVGYFDARIDPPTLAELERYDAVVTWPNAAYADMVATGDTLAAYVDGGGAVVCAAWCWYLNGNHLDGAIMGPTYNPFTGLGSNYYFAAALGWYDPGHPIMDGVTALTDEYRDSVDINPGADSVAKWDDGEWLVATMGTVVGVNANPGDYGSYTGDMIPLYHNAILWAISGEGRYLILQDQNPWGLTANQDILGMNRIGYDVLSSTYFGAVDLSQYDKVLVPSQQPYDFYAGLSAERTWIEDYIAAGGTFEFHGASYFTDDWAGLPMPTGFTCTPQDVDSSDLVTIVDPGHPLMTIPHAITDPELDNWGTSTHGHLIDLLPNVEEIVTNDNTGEPCLIVQHHGDGWVVATMMSMEWAYYFGYSEVLENMLLYLPWVDVAEDHFDTGSKGLALHGNWPNPFRSQTTLRYELPAQMPVSLKVFDASGRLVRTLLDGTKGAGAWTLTWDGRDDAGRILPSGTYFCTLRAQDDVRTRTMLLLK